jgi:hypothetical protein
MRLGKEQAVGYVEDTGIVEHTGFVENPGADALPAQEPAISQPDEVPLTASTQSALTVS